MAYLQAYQRKMIRIYFLSDPNRKRTKAPPLNHHMTLRSRGIRGHVYEMRNHKLNSPKTRRFAFTNIVSVTKDFQTPRSIIRRPFLILKTIFLVGLSWHIYRVYGDTMASRMKNLHDITLILCNPKQLQLRRLKWWNTSVILTNCSVNCQQFFGSWPQMFAYVLPKMIWLGHQRTSPWTVQPLMICLLFRP